MKFSILFFFFVLTGTLVAQQRTVTGTVTSSDDAQRMIGVNILIKGTTTGDITDFDGRFSITVPSEESILVFSYTGYESQEVSVRGLSNLDVVMKVSAASLGEIVVTGHWNYS